MKELRLGATLQEIQVVDFKLFRGQKAKVIDITGNKITVQYQSNIKATYTVDYLKEHRFVIL